MRGVPRPRVRHERLQVVHLAVPQRREPAALPVAPEVGGVHREPVVRQVLGERDDLAVVLRAGEAVAKHHRDVGVRSP